jgi:hypothetical protein
MAEESNNLRETLAQLHEQLRAAPDLGAETRRQLQQVVADIHALLEQAPPAGTSSPAGPLRALEQESIVARLGSAEREFQATHPTLAGIVGSIIDALGRMGI